MQVVTISRMSLKHTSDHFIISLHHSNIIISLSLTSYARFFISDSLINQAQNYKLLTYSLQNQCLNFNNMLHKHVQKYVYSQSQNQFLQSLLQCNHACCSSRCKQGQTIR